MERVEIGFGHTPF